jgi:hypothetical protein
MRRIAFALILAGSVSASATVYVTLADGAWGTVDVATGAFTQLGASSSWMGDVAIDPVSGQAWGIRSDAKLVKIDKTNGADTVVANSTYTNNLAATANGTLLMSNGDLFKVSQTDGSLTSDLPYSFNTIYDLAVTGSGLVFGTDSSNLYKRQLGTLGGASFVGSMGASSVYGLAFENGVLYGFGIRNFDHVLFKVNTSTGAGYDFITMTGLESRTVYGAAGEDGVVPEPATMLTLASGAWLLRRRRSAR